MAVSNIDRDAIIAQAVHCADQAMEATTSFMVEAWYQRGSLWVAIADHLLRESLVNPTLVPTGSEGDAQDTAAP